MSQRLKYKRKRNSNAKGIKVYRKKKRVRKNRKGKAGS